MLYPFFPKRSFGKKLIISFMITSIIPIILFNIFSYYNVSKIVRENVDELISTNLEQTKSSLNVWLDSYEDILFQIYTDDNIVNLVDKINRNEDLAGTRNQLRRILRGLFYTKEYIQSITIISDNGTVVFYDQLTASNTENSWLNNLSISKEQLYEEVSADNKTHVISTQRASTFAAETYYLFHLGHRIIDYKNVEKKSGVVIVSINEELLGNICTSIEDERLDEINSFNFIVDKDGYVVSYIDPKQLARQVIDGDFNKEERKKAYQQFVNENHVFDKGNTSVQVSFDPKIEWDIINVSDQSKLVERLNAQYRVLGITILLSLSSILIIIALLTKHLTSSIQKVVLSMKRAGKGELSARVEMDNNMSVEIETIAVQFNNMLGKLEDSIEKKKEANRRQKDAEIRALEAQINPHFLYNTLDTINWMAIDKDEFEISNAISSLAIILRYAIDNSNGTVTIREEAEWLKKYIFLQQTRLKNAFECNVHIEPEVLNYKIHKLLLQPFIENAILHGFDGIYNIRHMLTVDIKSQGDSIVIYLFDNGKGMELSLIQEINRRNFKKNGVKNHMGMENAITRIHMYYGNNAKVKINSALGKGTEIIIRIPKIQ